MTVTSERGERLAAGWVPAGFGLSDHGETNLGGAQGVDYAPADRTRGSAEILRVHSNDPLSDLMLGSNQNVPVEVQGHAGIVNDAPGPPDAVWAAWTMAPGLEVEVQGNELTHAQVLEIADSVRYQAGGPFIYPIQPQVSVTRAQALATLGPTRSNARAALTSVGELDSVRQRRANHRSTLLRDFAVTQPVWVAWTAANATDQRANVVDAQSGQVLTTMSIDPRALDALTDRNTPACAPPLGVLTRAEARYLSELVSGTTVHMLLTTQGALAATSLSKFAGWSQCEGACDAGAPVWMILQSASGQSLNCRGCGTLVGVTGPVGPTGSTTTTEPGSWSVALIDARTGPQSTPYGDDLNGVASGGGPPPADVLAFPDLSPV